MKEATTASPVIERNLARFVAIARTLLGERGIGSIIEVGARDCRETLGFLSCFPAAKVYAFECNPDTLPLCRARLADKPNAALIEKAVSDRSGTLSFYPIDAEATTANGETPNFGASSLFQASGNFELEHYRQKEIRVQATTLAEFMGERDVAGADLLWMDIQGAELAALKGLGGRLADVALIHTEVEFLEIYRGQPLFGEIRAFLEANGFCFLGFTIYSRHSADAVFANRARVSMARRISAWLRHRYLVGKWATWLRHRLKRALSGGTGG